MGTGRTKTPSPVLRARSLAKCYDRGVPSLGRLLREIADPKTRSPTGPGVLWAVRDVTFDLERGHSLGVIGRNGAGKSTLLRLLAGTARPTSGTVESDARIACLLDLGIGFHPMETGRQNAETSLRLLAGMSRREARQALREVEDFAEIGPFFERPLRTYSAGMHLRLAFAVASLLSPELLITDEVIVVGDAAFQRKCERWFDAFISGGGSLVLCSHDLSQVTRLCENALWLDAGIARELGASREVARHYRESLAEEGTAGVQHATGAATSLPCELVDLHLTDPSGDEVRSVKYGDTIVVTADVRAPVAVPEIHVGLTRADLTPIYGVSSDMDHAVPERIGPGLYRFRLTFPDLPLTPGPHRLRAHAMDETGTRLYDTVEIRFAVEGDEEEGLIRLSGGLAVKILTVVGTRPEAIKMAPVIAEARRRGLAVRVCATAQHRELLDQVLGLFAIVPDRDLDLMRPAQTLADFAARALAAVDRVLAAERPDWVLVQGDTTTAMVAALAGFYRSVPVGHVEAGLRTGDLARPFPEEMNRRTIDMLSRAHFAPTLGAGGNLLREGIAASSIHVTGNTVVDALLEARAMPCPESELAAAAVPPLEPNQRLVLVTAHRRESFGDGMRAIARAVARLAAAVPDVRIVYPVHPNPNVREPMEEILAGTPRVHLISPLPYLAFVHLMSRAHLIVSDSGGVQEEAPTLGVPALVLRETTERPEAIEAGAVRLVGVDEEAIVRAALEVLGEPAVRDAMARAINPYGDGQAAARIVRILLGEPWTPFASAGSG